MSLYYVVHKNLRDWHGYIHEGFPQLIITMEKWFIGKKFVSCDLRIHRENRGCHIQGEKGPAQGETLDPTYYNKASSQVLYGESLLLTLT